MTSSPDDLVPTCLYGFPLVFNLDQVARYVATGIGKNAAAPWNTFSHARSLAGPEDTFVTINNDTVYSMAQLDMSVGPILLTVPATAGRYYVLQFVSAWTDNFAYIGHRATGTDAGQYLLVPSDWEGESPHGAVVVRVPTRVASIVGRWAVNGDDDDMAVVHALQDATTLEPIDANAVAVGLPGTRDQGTEAATFWSKYVTWSQEFPPAPRDEPLHRSTLAQLADDSAEAVAGREAGFQAGRATLDAILASGGGDAPVNGWNLTYHAFDYNLDYFEVGSPNDPEFTITDPQRRIVQRAGAALGGLWGNQAFEAAYIATYVDDHGDQLTGEHSYTLHLNPTPPVGAFWSLTMYDVPNYYLVANSVDRYSVGNRTPGLQYEADGSLVITMSHEQPADLRGRANWLPTPAGAFRPILRMYEPAQEVLDKSYTVPAITRI